MDVDEFIVDVNRSLFFQDTVQRLRYKPEDPYIKTIKMGIRIRDESKDNDFIAYIECRVWNIASQKENTFWNYAYEYEKNQEDKPFRAVCGYLGNKITAISLIKGKKTTIGWAVFISDFTVDLDVLKQYPTLDREQLELKILSAVADILQYSFLFKPVYGFICDKELLPVTLDKSEFKRLGQIGQTNVYMKKY